MGFVKLDQKILDSSIWLEDSDTRVCWICLLAMADPDGLVESTAPGIARRAGISLDATRKALSIFEAPDPDSKNPSHDGKRIERVSGGYQLLNYAAYRRKDYTSTERSRRFRERARAASVGSHENDTEREALQPDPIASFMQRFPENLESLRPVFTRYYEMRTEVDRDALIEKLLALFAGTDEHEAKVQHFLAGLKPSQRTPEIEHRFRVNQIVNRFNIPGLEE